jgi:hypothetical protein
MIGLKILLYVCLHVLIYIAFIFKSYPHEKELRQFQKTKPEGLWSKSNRALATATIVFLSPFLDPR